LKKLERRGQEQEGGSKPMAGISSADDSAEAGATAVGLVEIVARKCLLKPGRFNRALLWPPSFVMTDSDD
jgi:hypothetical protein